MCATTINNSLIKTWIVVNKCIAERGEDHRGYVVVNAAGCQMSDTDRIVTINTLS